MPVKWGSLLFLVFISVVYTSPKPMSTPSESYAVLWKRGTPEEKKIFLSGINIGLALSKNYLQSWAKVQLQGVDSIQQITLENMTTLATDSILSQLSFHSRGYTENQMISMMDALYSKEANQHLSFQEIYWASIQELSKRVSKGATK